VASRRRFDNVRKELRRDGRAAPVWPGEALRFAQRAATEFEEVSAMMSCLRHVGNRGRWVARVLLAGKDLDYNEIWDQFLGPEVQPRADLFIEDRLHNNAAGFKNRAEVVRPHLP
jgi:hypothetical protein